MCAIKELGNLLHLWTYPITNLSIEEIKEAIEEFAKEKLPSGSGINWGCLIDLDHSDDTKVTIHFRYQHMNPEGFYVYISDHTIIIYATFTGFLMEWDEDTKAKYIDFFEVQQELASEAHEKYIVINGEEPIDNEHLCEEYLGRDKEYYFLPDPDEFFNEMEMRFHYALTK